jgi:hypothetical protein
MDFAIQVEIRIGAASASLLSKKSTTTKRNCTPCPEEAILCQCVCVGQGTRDRMMIHVSDKTLVNDLGTPSCHAS